VAWLKIRIYMNAFSHLFTIDLRIVLVAVSVMLQSSVATWLRYNEGNYYIHTLICCTVITRVSLLKKKKNPENERTRRRTTTFLLFFSAVTAIALSLRIIFALSVTSRQSAVYDYSQPRNALQWTSIPRCVGLATC
jgi:hypothetical protein